MYNYQYFLAYKFSGKNQYGACNEITENMFRDVIAPIDNPEALRVIERAIIRENEQNGWYDVKVVVFNFILIKTF